MSFSSTFYQKHLGAVQEATSSNVVFLAASQLDHDINLAFYEWLQQQGPMTQLTLVVYTKGGETNAVRRLALLLKEYSQHVQIIAPYFCQSAGTILALSADQIVYGPLSSFSAIDPHLHGQSDGDSTAISSMDIHSFSAMCEAWFNIPAEQSDSVLPCMTEAIFPPSLTAFYRRTLETQQTAEALLALNYKDESTCKRIAKHLVEGYHSHDYCITGRELADLGLHAEQNNALVAKAWPLVKETLHFLGAGHREAPESPWCDAIIATSQGVITRMQNPMGMAPKWEPLQWEPLQWEPLQ